MLLNIIQYTEAQKFKLNILYRVWIWQAEKYVLAIAALGLSAGYGARSCSEFFLSWRVDLTVSRGI